MDPLTAAGLGLSIYGQLKSASAKRDQLRQQQQIERRRIDELELRRDHNIDQTLQDGATVQRQAMASVAAAGASLSAGAGLTQMNDIANQIAEEVSRIRFETNSQIRSQEAGIDNLGTRRKQIGQETMLNVMGQTALTFGKYNEIKAREGKAVPQKDSLLKLGEN